MSCVCAMVNILYLHEFDVFMLESEKNPLANPTPVYPFYLFSYLFLIRT